MTKKNIIRHDHWATIHVIISYGVILSLKYITKTLDDFKEDIMRVIKKINTSVLESTFLNFTKRCNLLIEKHGGHIDKK